jgi:hypothetical protein
MDDIYYLYECGGRENKMKTKSLLTTLGLLAALIVVFAAPKQVYATPLHDGPITILNDQTMTAAATLDVWVYGIEDLDQIPSYFVDNNLVPTDDEHNLFTYEVTNINGQPILSTSLLLDPDSTQFIMEIGSVSGATQGQVTPSGEYNIVFFSGFLMPGASDTYYVLADTEPILGTVGLDFPVGGGAGQSWVPDCPWYWNIYPDHHRPPEGVPEPGTLLLLGSALIGMAGIRRLYTRK